MHSQHLMIMIHMIWETISTHWSVITCNSQSLQLFRKSELKAVYLWRAELDESKYLSLHSLRSECCCQRSNSNCSTWSHATDLSWCTSQIWLQIFVENQSTHSKLMCRRCLRTSCLVTWCVELWVKWSCFLHGSVNTLRPWRTIDCYRNSAVICTSSEHQVNSILLWIRWQLCTFVMLICPSIILYRLLFISHYLIGCSTLVVECWIHNWGQADVAVCGNHLTTTGNYMPYGIATQQRWLSRH